ncbi:MAG: aminotransferase class I/II-fold pyridoxal phosphate-dependent enzyme [Bacteroidetes bacterium]|nr:aminotransferase class I/II-fold pyridoxal phosphate-dependent enzyme [Bacteroidota bacterium]
MIIQPANRLDQIQEYYFAGKLREIRQRNAAGEDIINLGIGNPDLPPSDEAIKSLITAAVEPGVHGYQPYKGLPGLREAFANWYLNTYGVELDPETEIQPLAGSKEGILHISMAFLNPGDQVLIPNPGYPTYLSNTRLAGGEPVFYSLRAENDWLPDLEELGKRDLSQVKLMWINYPHMPTGAKATEDIFDQLIEFGRKHQILICHDNPYSLVLNPEPISILGRPGAREVALELNSLSKSHNMAGWRIGMVAAEQEYIDTILRVKSNMDSGMYMPLQQAAITALNSSYEWHRERNQVFAERKKIAGKIMEILNCNYSNDSAGMFLWGKIPANYEHSEDFSELILNQCRVFITPGFIFGSEGDKYIRISLCMPASRLEDAMDRVKKLNLVKV